MFGHVLWSGLCQCNNFFFFFSLSLGRWKTSLWIFENGITEWKDVDGEKRKNSPRNEIFPRLLSACLLFVLVVGSFWVSSSSIQSHSLTQFQSWTTQWDHFGLTAHKRSLPQLRNSKLNTKFLWLFNQLDQNWAVVIIIPKENKYKEAAFDVVLYN